MKMREMTCCFTGHRKLPEPLQVELAEKLEETMIRLIDRGIRFYGAGGARGFDTLAAQIVLQLQTKYPHIKLILVLPCLEQTRGWNVEDVRKYEQIKSAADKVVYISKEYTKDCMLKRNRHLVNNSSVCVCYLTEDIGGTACTVRYAKQKGLEVINLA